MYMQSIIHVDAHTAIALTIQVAHIERHVAYTSSGGPDESV